MPLTKVQAGLLEATGTPSAGTFLRGDGSWSGTLVSGTAVTLTNQTAPEFTGIPSWVKRITVMLSGVSGNSTGIPIIQLGTGSTPTYATSGYLGSGIQLADAASVNGATVTTGIQIRSALAASLLNGAVTLSLLTGNTWVAHGAVSDSATARGYLVASSIPLGAALTAVRLFIDGTQFFDAGTVNILYEG